MKLLSSKLEDTFIHYYSDTKNQHLVPVIWAYENHKTNRWNIGGNIAVLEGFLEKIIRKKGFKTSKKAFSFLLGLTQKVNNFTPKKKKKYCLFDRKGKEYKFSTIKSRNEFWTDIQKVIKKKPKRKNK